MGINIDTPNGVEIPLQFEGTKLRFRSRVPTKRDLSSCIYIYMTSIGPWEPSEVSLGEAVSSARSIFSVVPDVQKFSPMSTDTQEVHEYFNSTLDEAHLHNINQSLVVIKERCLQQIQALSPTV